jgi:hypothetical protein
MTLYRPEVRYKEQNYRTRAPENDIKRLLIRSVEGISVFPSIKEVFSPRKDK